MGKKSGSGSGIRDEQPGSYFLEFRNHFFGLKYLNSLMRIRVPGSGMKTIRTRDGKKLDPGSRINIPDLQHSIQVSKTPIFLRENVNVKPWRSGIATFAAVAGYPLYRIVNHNDKQK
jgi:hypothetical protein